MGTEALRTLLVGKHSARLADRLRIRGHEVVAAAELEPIEALQQVARADLLLVDTAVVTEICQAQRAAGEVSLLLVAVVGAGEDPQSTSTEERLDDLLRLDDPALEQRLVLLERRARERRRFAACAAGLTAAAEQYRVLFEEASDAIIVMDDQGRITDVNPAGCALMGYAADEIIGRVPFEFVDDQSVADFVGRVDLMGALGAVRAERILVRKDGSRLPIETTGTQLSNGRLLGTARDVSERQQAQQALRESEELFRRLSEAAFDGLVIHEQGTILEANEPMARMFGYQPQEMIGMSVLQLATPEWRERVRQAFVEGREQAYEAMGLRRDGTRFHGELCAKGVTWHGKPARVVAVRDISVRKQAERNLQQLAALRQAVTSKIIAAQEQERQLLARELHDVVGQMLAVVKMQTAWIAARAEHPDDVRLAADQLAEKIDETLVVVRQLSFGLRPPVLDDLGLGCALETLAQETVRRTGIGCAVEAPEIEAPATTGIALYRIAQEALANCLRHSQARSVRMTLAQDRSGSLLLTVEDDGRGISDEQRDSPRSLGIASMRERAVLLGGTLTVERGRTGGTVVCATIPPADRLHPEPT